MATVGAADLRPLVAGEIIAPADLARPPLAIVRLAVAPEARDADFLVRFEARRAVLDLSRDRRARRMPTTRVRDRDERALLRAARARG